MRVFEADAAALGALDGDLRPGERLQRFLENPLTFAAPLGLADDAEKLPFVVVTNPDIFYYGLYFQYRRNDQRNVFSKFIANFQYVVIDEFHYYDNKQFANFLFFFALWKQWDYFSHGRSICLLSATPRGGVYRYLDRLFGDTWVQISPDNEPPESGGYPTTPTLTELHLTVVAEQLDDWVTTNRTQIESWQTESLDSVIISSSLGRINDCHALLVHLDPTRITGPEGQEERQRVRPLILATPTVDIGYNFGRPGKRRQSIDRLICDARFGDELTQRIGRAGRVLGREETDRRSEAIVLVSDDAASELRAYDGKTLSRHEWAGVVASLEHLPPKHRLDGYIRTQAVMEAFYPAFRISDLMKDEEAALEELYELIRSVFAPQSKPRKGLLKGFFYTYDRRRRWLSEPEAKRWALGEQNVKVLAQHLADYISWRKSSKGVEIREQGEKYRAALPGLLRAQPQQRELLAFIELQVALTKAIFSFREAWQGPPTAVYDPHHLLSSETVNRYDLLHLLANYELRPFRDRRDFTRKLFEKGIVSPTIRGGKGLLEGSPPQTPPFQTVSQRTGADELVDLYVEIERARNPKLTLGFDYLSPWPHAEFVDRCCRSVVALSGLQLTARERGLDGQTIALDHRFREAIEHTWIPCLVVAEESWWPLLAVLRGSPFYARDLQVDFADGTCVPYKVVTGTAAFHILPELKRHYAMLDKKLSDEPIFA